MVIPYTKGWLEDKIIRALGRAFLKLSDGSYLSRDDRWQDFYEVFEELTDGEVTFCKEGRVEVGGSGWSCIIYHKDKEYALLYLMFLFSKYRLD